MAKEVTLRSADEGKLAIINQELTLNLTPRELLHLQDHFRKVGREPTDVEVQAIAQTWSEHCFHRTFKAIIETDRGSIDGIFSSYISRGTEELNPPWCFDVFRDNAGIVEFDHGHLLAVKVETHNHPSAIEPFGGAATGVGGVIRDVLGVWAEPIACTDVLCFGPPEVPFETLPLGVKHPKYIFKGVVSGVGNYGNNMGIPTVNGAVVFDNSYIGNVVVFCGCIGVLPVDKFVRDTKPGNVMVLAGGKTGRDGIHGATFSSANLTSESEISARSAVQIPNPIEEEKLVRAIIKIRDLRLASGITDLGAGGISSAVGEMARRSRCGATVDLERVPLKVRDLDPWEIFLSESQERMLLSVPRANLVDVLKIFEDEQVETSVIGSFDNRSVLRIMHQDELVGELDMEFLFNPPRARLQAVFSDSEMIDPNIEPSSDPEADLLTVLNSHTVTSKEGIVRTYDHQVRGNAVLTPYLGFESVPCDASVMKPLDSSDICIVVSCGINPRYGKIDPYWMVASSIDEAIRNNVCVGGRRICLLDNFAWASPERHDELGGLLRASKACYDFAKAYGTPFISGKDSLYNESPLGPVTPTVMITALGLLPNMSNAVTPLLKEPNDGVFLLGITKAELGGSEYYKLKGHLGGSVPKVDPRLAPLTYQRLTSAIDGRLVSACHDLAEGGLAVAAAEMALSPSRGLDIELAKVPRENVARDDFVLFSESNTRILVTVPNGSEDEFVSAIRGVPHAKIGHVASETGLRIFGLDGNLIINVRPEDIRRVWSTDLI